MYLLPCCTAFHLSSTNIFLKKLKKRYYDFLSDYLVHSSMYFQKSMDILFAELAEELPYAVKKCFLTTDGAKGHFKSCISFYWATTVKRKYGKEKKCVLLYFS